MTSSTDEISKFAVVVPAFNAEQTLAESISSAYRAGAASVVVVDDGSTDETAKLAASLGCLVIAQKNAGAAAARRAGILAVEEPFVVLLDSDDRLVREGVTESIRVLMGLEGSVASLGRTIGIGHGSAPRTLRHWPEGVNLQSLLQRGHAPGPPAAFVWRTNALRKVIADHPAAVWPRFAEDYEFIVRGALMGNIHIHNEISCEYQWTGGKSSTSPRSSIVDAERIRMHYCQLNGFAAVPRSSAEIRSMVFMRHASAHTSRRSMPMRLGFTAAAALSNPVGSYRRVLRRLTAKG